MCTVLRKYILLLPGYSDEYVQNARFKRAGHHNLLGASETFNKLPVLNPRRRRRSTNSLVLRAKWLGGPTTDLVDDALRLRVVTEPDVVVRFVDVAFTSENQVSQSRRDLRG